MPDSSGALGRLEFLLHPGWGGTRQENVHIAKPLGASQAGQSWCILGLVSPATGQVLATWR